MCRPRLRCCDRVPIVLAFACVLFAATPFHAAELLRVGTEFRVNATTTGFHGYPALSVEANGDFVVTWTTYGGADGSARGVFARRFRSTGVPLSSDFQVNSYITGDQALPAVAVDADGDFVIAWIGYGSQDGSDAGVFAQRFNSSGSAQATEFQVNSFTSGVQRSPSMSLDANGDFVIAWDSQGQDGDLYGVFARRWTSAGVAQATEFQVNSFTTQAERYPSVSLDADGDFVVAWSSYGSQDGSSTGVFAQRFNSTGAPQAIEFQVNAYTADIQSSPQVSLDDDGDFAIAWQSLGQDSSLWSVFARRWSPAGVSLTDEVPVNSYTPGNQIASSVSQENSGEFVVSWQSIDQDGSAYGVFARSFNASGLPQTDEIQVNTYTTNMQAASTVFGDASGKFVVIWHGYGQDAPSLRSWRSASRPPPSSTSTATARPLP